MGQKQTSPRNAKRPMVHDVDKKGKNIEEELLLFQTSRLPFNIIKVLREGYYNGFSDNLLLLYNCGINDEMMPDICKWLELLGDRIVQANFLNNNITSKGASVLFKYMCKNAHIVDLMLGENKIDDACMEDCGKMLQENKTIKCLLFGDFIGRGNKISDDGIEILSMYLIGSISLIELDFSNNKGITDKSATFINDIVTKSTLRKIILNGTSISIKERTEIKKLLRQPVSTRDIPILSNSKSAAKICD